MAHWSAFLHQLVIHYGYAGLFLVTVLGNVGLPAAIEVVMLTGGALAATGHLPGVGPIPGWLIVGAVGLAGELCGGLVLYAIGWYGGLPFVHRYGKYIRFREHELERVHAFYERHGRSTVFWCRFIPFVRGVSALPPGISRMQKRYFLTYTALGSAIFCFGLAALGELTGRNADVIAADLHDFALAIGGAVAVIVLAAFVVWRVRRARRAQSPATPRPNNS